MFVDLAFCSVHKVIKFQLNPLVSIRSIEMSCDVFSILGILGYRDSREYRHQGWENCPPSRLRQAHPHQKNVVVFFSEVRSERRRREKKFFISR